jgi:hypothetical protein
LDADQKARREKTILREWGGSINPVSLSRPYTIRGNCCAARDRAAVQADDSYSQGSIDVLLYVSDGDEILSHSRTFIGSRKKNEGKILVIFISVYLKTNEDFFRKKNWFLYFVNLIQIQ